MSSLYVRALARQWLTTTPGLVLPYFETVNSEQRPSAPAWATLSFVSALNATQTYCGHMHEAGTFDYIALGAPGVGDADLLAAAEHDVALLMAQADPQGLLTLIRANPPEDFPQAGGVPWFTVSMSVEYLYTPALAVP